MLEDRINDEGAEAIDPPSTDGGGSANLESVESGEATLIDPPSTDGGGN